MQRQALSSRLVVPALLAELVADGVWPGAGKTVARERVRAFAAEEDEIHFEAPPFRTIAEEMAAVSPNIVRDYWRVYGALDQIEPAEALIIGDFGPGSDAPIILDYRANSDDPPVLRLCWSGRHTAWVRGADRFADFAAMLGLPGGVA